MTKNNKTEQQVLPSTRLIPLANWANFHPWPPVGGLRHLVFHEKINGLNKGVKRIGRRVLLDETAFFVWVEKQNAGGAD